MIWIRSEKKGVGQDMVRTGISFLGGLWVNARFGKNYRALNLTWIKSFALLAFLKMNGQVYEFEDRVQFQYGVAPSLGKHQMETYEYSFNKSANILGMHSTFQVAYLNSRFTYFEVPEIKDMETYERLHLVNFNMQAVKALGNQWKLSIRFNPQFSSNFSDGLSTEDVIFAYRFGLSKTWNNSRVLIGMERSTVFGEPQWLPHLYYGYELSPSLYVQAGFPHSYFSFKINQRHMLSANAMAQGNYYNITGTSSFTDFGTASNTKLSFSSFNFSLKHQYKIQHNITAISQLGLLSNNDLKVEGSNGDSLLTFDTNESVYFSMGLQFKLNKNDKD